MASFTLNTNPYFEDIEALFVAKRGKNLLISSKEWQLIADWETRGIPLHIVIRGIEDSFKAQANITSLAYCTKAIERGYADWQSSQVGKSETAVIEYLCQICFDTKDRLIPAENPKFTGDMRSVPCECV